MTSQPIRRESSRRLLAPPLLLLAYAAGCGGGDGNGAPYQVSGSVAYNGQPVPVGFIVFAPNGKKGNHGPGGGAKIEAGRYQTLPGKGVVGGAYEVVITGFDGVPVETDMGLEPRGKALFPTYKAKVTLPKEDASHDFDVPWTPSKTPAR